MTTQSQYRLTQQELTHLEEAVAIALRLLARQRPRAFLLVYECYSPRWVVEGLRECLSDLCVASAPA